jgi:hypothetical protein
MDRAHDHIATLPREARHSRRAGWQYSPRTRTRTHVFVSLDLQMPAKRNSVQLHPRDAWVRFPAASPCARFAPSASTTVCARPLCANRPALSSVLTVRCCASLIAFAAVLRSAGRRQRRRPKTVWSSGLLANKSRGRENDAEDHV